MSVASACWSILTDVIFVDDLHRNLTIEYPTVERYSENGFIKLSHIHHPAAILSALPRAHAYVACSDSSISTDYTFTTVKMEESRIRTESPLLIFFGAFLSTASRSLNVEPFRLWMHLPFF